jgi:hypothetical protein
MEIRKKNTVAYSFRERREGRKRKWEREGRRKREEEGKKECTGYYLVLNNTPTQTSEFPPNFFENEFRILQIRFELDRLW